MADNRFRRRVVDGDEFVLRFSHGFDEPAVGKIPIESHGRLLTGMVRKTHCPRLSWMPKVHERNFSPRTAGRKRIFRVNNIRKNHVYPGISSSRFALDSRIRALPKCSGLRRSDSSDRSARSIPRSGAHDEKEPHCTAASRRSVTSLGVPCICPKQRHAVRRDRRRPRLHQQCRARRGLEMASGYAQGSRWGMKGSEDLGGGTEGHLPTGKRLRRELGTARPGWAHVRTSGLRGIEREPLRHGDAGRQYDSVVDYLAPTTANGNWAGYLLAHPYDNDNTDNSFRLSNSVKYASPEMAGFRSAACTASATTRISRITALTASVGSMRTAACWSPRPICRPTSRA